MAVDGKTFIITGGGSGLGEATARMFAGAGANVVVADLDKSNADKVAGDIGDNARAFECNVTSEEQVQAVVDFSVARFIIKNPNIIAPTKRPNINIGAAHSNTVFHER